MLRHPIERYISSYIYNKYKNSRFLLEGDISEYIDSEFGRSQGYEYVKFIGGPDKNGNYTSNASISRAKENLHKFKIVGILERLDNFRRSFERTFGVKLNVGHHNTSPKSEQFVESITDDRVKERIEEICGPDLEIYQYAMERCI
jgi:hypothetical protein